VRGREESLGIGRCRRHDRRHSNHFPRCRKGQSHDDERVDTIPPDCMASCPPVPREAPTPDTPLLWGLGPFASCEGLLSGGGRGAAATRRRPPPLAPRRETLLRGHGWRILPRANASCLGQGRGSSVRGRRCGQRHRGSVVPARGMSIRVIGMVVGSHAAAPASRAPLCSHPCQRCESWPTCATRASHGHTTLLCTGRA
jgi:hypothetical protein